MNLMLKQLFGYLVHVKMDTASQHWEILQKLGTDLANRVRSFMVLGGEGEGVMVATEDGLGYWFGKVTFEWSETITTTKPIQLDVPDLVSMAHGFHHIVMLNKRGEIYSMGQNEHGQLGIGTEDDEICFSPQLISIPHKIISVRCGIRHSLALTEDGKVWAWGSNISGQVGVPRSTVSLPSPRQISGLDSHRVVAVDGGGYHSLALTDQGEVYVWGENEKGQFGDGSWSSGHTPIRIPTPSPIKSMAAGHNHTLLLTRTGEVYTCGDNRSGELGLSTTMMTPHLSKVEGLPLISEIASHSANRLSFAMSSDKRCFVWGFLRDGKLQEKNINVSTPRELPSIYSTLQYVLSSFSPCRNTTYSVIIPETPPNRLSVRMCRMFDIPETSDVQFMVEERTIYAHRYILSNSSDYFARMFSERWLAPVDPQNPIVNVTIPDFSYEAFHAFLRFLYTDCLEVHFDLLPELFELATQYLESNLQQLCLSRMRATLTSTTCCLYYPLTHRYSLPELATFQQELVQFVSTQMSEVVKAAAYHSMEPDLRDNLTNAAKKLPGHLTYHYGSYQFRTFK